MFILALLFVFINIDIANALTFKKVGNVFVNDRQTSPNVATLQDIIFEKPNIATLPDNQNNFIEDNLSENIKENNTEIKNDNKIIPSINLNKKKENNKKEIKLTKKTPHKPKIKKTLSKDKFSNISLNEGEEILVSMSSPKSIAKNLSITKPKTLKRRLKNKSNKRKLNDPFRTTPIIRDRQIIITDNNSIDKKYPVFPITIKKDEIAEKEKFIEKENNDRINNIEEIKKQNKQSKEKDRIYYGTPINNNPFLKAFSSLRPEQPDAKIFTKTPGIKKEKTIANISSDVLKRDLNQTYLSDNKYLSFLETPDEEEREDDEEEAENNSESKQESNDISNAVKINEKKEITKDETITDTSSKLKDVIDINAIKNQMSKTKSNSRVSGSLKIGNRKILQMKIDFEKSSSAISGESVNLLRSFAQIVTDRPTDSIEITIPSSVMHDINKKKLVARRLSLVSNILRETGISDRQIRPVLSNRDENSFTFRVVSNDKKTKLKSGSKDIFGDEDNTKEYDIMKW